MYPYYKGRVNSITVDWCFTRDWVYGNILEDRSSWLDGVKTMF